MYFCCSEMGYLGNFSLHLLVALVVLANAAPGALTGEV